MCTAASLGRDREKRWEEGQNRETRQRRVMGWRNRDQPQTTSNNKGTRVFARGNRQVVDTVVSSRAGLRLALAGPGTALPR